MALVRVAGDIFGYGLAVSGMTVLAGAYPHNTAAGADAYNFV